MPERAREHQLTVSVAGHDIDGWTSASIESDILTPGDAFTLAHAYDPRVFALVRLDAELTIAIDGAVVMNGFVTARQGDWSSFTVSGKDRVARMVAESAPLDLDFRGRDLASVAEELAAPWFERVVFSNAENRALMRGRGARGPRARAGARDLGAPLLDARTDEHRVAPGSSKWDALDELLQRAEYLAWSSATGRDLIIARPDYDQDAAFAFHVTREHSNCLGIQYRESNESRFAAIVTVGTSAGDDLNHAANTLHRVGVAKDADTFDGVGQNFLHPKRLVVPVEARTVAECQRRAERERAEREAASFEVDILAWGFGAAPPASERVLYTPDTVVAAYSENTPVDGAYYVTARTFTLSRNEEQTRMRCVRLGVAL